jgi:hypothetical protein
VFAIADSVPVIFQNHGIRVRGGIVFSVNTLPLRSLRTLHLSIALSISVLESRVSSQHAGMMYNTVVPDECVVEFK